MKKSIWKKFTVSTFMAIVVLLVIPFTVFAADPPTTTPSGSNFQVVDITSDIPWITGQKDVGVNVDATATDKATITVEVKNVSDVWLLNYGKATIDSLTTNLANLGITPLTSGWVMDNKGQTATFSFVVDASMLTQQGMANVNVKGEGKIGIKIFGIYLWLDASCFKGSENNVFGVDSTLPSVSITVTNHSGPDGHMGIYCWQSISLLTSDALSGIKCVTDTAVKQANGDTIHTIVVVDNAGNKIVQTVVTKSYTLGTSTPAIACCENCWHSLVLAGDISGVGCFTVFAPGGWVYYTCPYCKVYDPVTKTRVAFSTEKTMRENYKIFVARGGYVPNGDFYHGLNYKP